MAETFRDLKVWKKAHELVLLTYALSKQFPKDEQYGLTQQLRRAVVSVAANIVEGWKRRTDRDNAHLLNVSEGSLEEAKYLLILSRDVDYLTEPDYQRTVLLCDEVGRMLNGLRRSLRS